MNRIIKFRAWDTKRKEMVGDENLVRLNQTWESEEYRWGENMTISVGDDLKLMQFTGLHDKNGKEIYEGDILVVRELHDGHNIYWHQSTGSAIPTVVKWDDRYLNWEVPLDSYYFEVIGNIYETPELLNKEDK